MSGLTLRRALPEDFECTEKDLEENTDGVCNGTLG